jgi:hypothetical protein
VTLRDAQPTTAHCTVHVNPTQAHLCAQLLQLLLCLLQCRALLLQLLLRLLRQLALVAQLLSQVGHLLQQLSLAVAPRLL